MEVTNPMLMWFSLIAFVVALAGIYRFHELKTPVAILANATIWTAIVVKLGVTETVAHVLEISQSENFGLIALLMCAMALVEWMAHYGLFDWIQSRLSEMGLSDRQQAAVLFFMTFNLSAAVDNLTTTIVMATIACMLFTGRNLVLAGIGIACLANAGGAFSPIGDVTTIMIWLHRTAEGLPLIGTGELITMTFLPSLTYGVIMAFSLIGQMVQTEINNDVLDPANLRRHLTHSEMFIIALCFGSFGLGVVAMQMGLPPYMGMATGLAIVATMSHVFHYRTGHKTHMEARIEHILQKIDNESLLFFIAILTAVAGLNVVGALDFIADLAFGSEVVLNALTIIKIVGSGILSAFVDNVPLMDIMLEIVRSTNPWLWSLMAYTIGIGGSLLLFGSAAAIVMNGIISAQLGKEDAVEGRQVDKLTPMTYIKFSLKPNIIAYFAGVLVWYIQMSIFS